MDPTTGAKIAVDAYGPYAFGLIAVCVIIAALVWAAVHVWSKVVKPQLDSSKQIAADNAAAQKDLSSTTENLRHLHVEMRSSQLEWMRFQRGQCPVCGDPSDNGHAPGGRVAG